jgi:4'-phosphopantetheinyl transferase
LEPLPSQEVHLWFASSDAAVPLEALESQARLTLSLDELARAATFRDEDARRNSLLARLLLRTVLSKYADVAPERWQFAISEYGRPEILESMNQAGLRFNLSHSGGLLVCAVSHERAIGVDVEGLDQVRSEAELLRPMERVVLVLALAIVRHSGEKIQVLDRGVGWHFQSS